MNFPTFNDLKFKKYFNFYSHLRYKQIKIILLSIILEFQIIQNLFLFEKMIHSCLYTHTCSSKLIDFNSQQFRKTR